MLHSSDRSKDFSNKRTFDWDGKYDWGFFIPTFYKISDLEQDRFIHPDGSLKFEFSIKKHQFQRRAITAEKEATTANKKVKNLMSLVKSLCPAHNSKPRYDDSIPTRKLFSPLCSPLPKTTRRRNSIVPNSTKL